VKEESQIEEMRAAVRGDRERARDARRRSAVSVPTLVEPKAPEPPRRRGLLARLLQR
jgi:hypothetical protein